MAQAGFAMFDMEWWHYTLVDEPYREESFDFTYRDFADQVRP